MTQVLIVQPYIPEYRVAFFDRLRTKLEQSGVDLVIAAQKGPVSRCDSRDDVIDLELVDVLERVARGRLRWRTPVTPWTTPDLVILEQAIKNLEGYRLLRRLRPEGTKAAMWGHGATFSQPVRRGRELWKRALTTRMDWFFAYTQTGARIVADAGYPSERITVVNNTIDTESLTADLARVRNRDIQEFREANALDGSQNALYLGRLEREKDIAFLVEMAAEARKLLCDFTLLVGGAGPEKATIDAARAAGVPVVGLGRLDSLEKAVALKLSKLLTIPSWVGLVAVESLVAGVPIVTRRNRNQMPESEYLRHGEDSLWLPYDVSPGAFAQAAVDLMLNDNRREVMRANAQKRSGDLSLQAMVDAFADGIFRCLETPPKDRGA